LVFLFLSGIVMACDGEPPRPPDASQPDASTNADVSDAGVAAVAPDQLFGKDLYLWLDADESATIVSDGGKVVEWKDRSPNPTVATARLPNNSSNITISPALANGHAALRVGPQAGIFEIAGGVDGGLIAVVAAYSNAASSSGVLVQGSHVTGAYLRLVGNSQGSSVIFAGNPVGLNVLSATSGWNDGRFHTFGVSYDSPRTKLAVRVDGTETTKSGSLSVNSDGHSFAGGYICLWCDAGGPEPPIQNALEGYLAEVIVARPATSLELAQLSAYFQKKYGLPF
jgi:hypothetical protein